jgi:hypothetical protein
MLVRDWSDNERAVRREPSFIEGGNMLRVLARVGLSLCAGLAAIAEAAQTERLIFLSTQLRPIEEAQKMRNLADLPDSGSRGVLRARPLPNAGDS